MSHSLPLISHRLLVAAAVQGRAPRPAQRAKLRPSGVAPARALELEVLPAEQGEPDLPGGYSGKRLAVAAS